MAFHYLVMPQMKTIEESNLLVSILVLLQKVLAIILKLEVSVSFRYIFVSCCNLMLFIFIVNTLIKCF